MTRTVADPASVTLRPEEAADREAVFAVNAAAFPTDAEAELVDALRAEAEPYRAWVAVADGAIVGHVAFSPVVATADTGVIAPALGLAPMAVTPAWQRRGLGSRLARASLAALDADGEVTVFVLGHPGFYPRFGFRSAIADGWRFAPGTEHVFFVRGPVAPGPGIVRFHAAFSRS